MAAEARLNGLTKQTKKGKRTGNNLRPRQVLYVFEFGDFFSAEQITPLFLVHVFAVALFALPSPNLLDQDTQQAATGNQQTRDHRALDQGDNAKLLDVFPVGGVITWKRLLIGQFCPHWACPPPKVKQGK
jgi:hypothetical protein